jgi:hypothetical protein
MNTLNIRRTSTKNLYKRLFIKAGDSFLSRSFRLEKADTCIPDSKAKPRYRPLLLSYQRFNTLQHGPELAEPPGRQNEYWANDRRKHH